MDLLLKLLVTPALVALATLAGRRWGGGVAGWLVGFPFTSAPVALILTIEQGPRFAAAAALGTLLGTASQAGFALVYGRVAARGAGWPVCAGGGTLAFAAATVLLRAAVIPAAEGALLVAGAAGAALLLLPRPVTTAAPRPPGRLDIPARVLLATAFIALLTSIAPLLGPRLAGLLSPFPLYAAVLAVFAHRLDGPQAGLAVVRGLLAGLFGFGSFFLVLSLTLVPLGAAAAFALALMAVAAVQTAALLLLRRHPRPPPDFSRNPA